LTVNTLRPAALLVALALALLMPGAVLAESNETEIPHVTMAPCPPDAEVCMFGGGADDEPLPEITPVPCPADAEVCAYAEPGVSDGLRLYLRGLEIDGASHRFEGKLWLDGGQLGASTGCNQISAAAHVADGTLFVDGPIASTEMACEGAAGAAERLLFEALMRGPFSIADGELRGDGVRILVDQAGETGSGEQPGDGEEQPERSLETFDLAMCRELVDEATWEDAFGPDGTPASDAGPRTILFPRVSPRSRR
jgi:hypothetical protein